MTHITLICRQNDAYCSKCSLSSFVYRWHSRAIKKLKITQHTFKGALYKQTAKKQIFKNYKI